MGVEGCLKRTKIRNQEVNQFGLWLQATFPTKRVVVAKTYDHHAETYDSSRYAKPIPEEEPKQSSAQGKKDIGWKQRAVEHGERSFARDNSRGNHNVRAKETRSGNTGRNRGERNDKIFFESQMEKERNNVGALIGQFEGRNHAGDSSGTYGIRLVPMQ